MTANMICRACVRTALVCWLFFTPAFVTAQPGKFQMEVIRDIAYHEGADADPFHHKLDIYVPKGHKDFPVLLFVHGGGWIFSTKEYYGTTPLFARNFTRYGIGVVSISHRLSPQVQHPEHMRDVARAFAWTWHNIGKYGGRNNEIFVSGHSAGGHLVALLATDARYLEAHKLTLAAIRGAMPISGVFLLNSPLFETPFGSDPARRADAAPINHINSNCPPFLIAYADRDFPHCDRANAAPFYKGLRAINRPAEIFEIPNRNHLTIFIDAFWDTDPLTRAMLSFMMGHTAVGRLQTDPASGVDLLGDFLVRYLERQ